ncbi:hypothetical protein Tco_1266748 [Tanacetum coccineum]
MSRQSLLLRKLKHPRYAVSSLEENDKMPLIKLGRASVPFPGRLKEKSYDGKEVLMKLKKLQVNLISTDKTNITRKLSKTGKHKHGNQKSTKEAKDSKPKPRKVNYGQPSVKIGQTLVNSQSQH